MMMSAECRGDRADWYRPIYAYWRYRCSKCTTKVSAQPSMENPQRARQGLTAASRIDDNNTANIILSHLSIWV